MTAYYCSQCGLGGAVPGERTLDDRYPLGSCLACGRTVLIREDAFDRKKWAGAKADAARAATLRKAAKPPPVKRRIL
jgi:hypothetical protein